MLITPTTKSITEYALTLSESDAIEAMAHPAAFGETISKQLRAISDTGG